MTNNSPILITKPGPGVFGTYHNVAASILRSSDGDCSNNAPSSYHSSVRVIGEFEQIPTGVEGPVYRLVPNTRGTAKLVLAEPVKWVHNADKKVGPSNGGNYATGDSRFNREVERITGSPFYGAIAIHDRYDTVEHYNALTR